MINKIFVGAGSSNIFALLYFLEYNKSNNINLLLIDKGNDIYTRKSTEIINGFGGAGAWSDGKYIFSNHEVSVPYVRDISKEDISKYYSFIRNMINKFHPNPSSINITYPSKDLDNIIPKQLNMNILQNECIHVGSSYNNKLLQNIFNYLKNNNVKFLFNTELLDIDTKNNNIIVINNNKKQLLKYNDLYLGLGRAGSKLINKIYKIHNCKLKYDKIHIGVRFETPTNKYINNLIDKQYDFKFTKKFNEDINIRTFCACHYSAYVTKEIISKNLSSYVQFNGEGFGKDDKTKYNNMSNFGIIAEVSLKNDLTPDVVYSNLQNKIMYHLIRNGIYKQGLALDGFFSSGKNTIKDIDIINERQFNELIKIQDVEVGRYLSEFIKCLDSILHFNGDFRIYIPEYKEYPGVIDHNIDMSVKNIPSNVKFIGDSGAYHIRGIVPSGVTGILAIKDTINTTEDKPIVIEEKNSNIVSKVIDVVTKRKRGRPKKIK